MRGRYSAHNFVSTPLSVRYVRFSTRLTERGVLSRSASEYRPLTSLWGSLHFIEISPSDNDQFFGDGITRRSASPQSARVRRRAPLCGGRLACRAVAPYTPQSVLAALWYFAGTPNSRRENAETFASLLVPAELSRSSLIFTPRDLKFIRPHTFYYKSAPKVTGGAVTFGAILYKSTGSRGIMPLAGCRGRAPARAQGAAPLGHFCQPGGEVRY